MASSNDQNEPSVPTSNVGKRSSADLLPRFYRTNSNKKFLQATVDQLTQPGTVKKLNGYIGRETGKAVTTKDIFLEAPDKTRQDYQFEPAAVIQDYLGNTTFFKDYIDHINHVEVFDGNVKNHARVNKEEFYSWNPHVCWDKFVNYQQYYWLPFGPDPINVLGQQLEVQSTYTVKGVDEVDNVAYLFTPNGLTRNPTLRLFRGQTYHFDIDAVGHPFSIKTRRTNASDDRYNDGVVGNGTEKGTITFTVPLDSPDVLFYVSENAVDTGGVFQVLSIDENTYINLETDFLGKKTYTIPNGTAKGLKVSNGMKLSFGGNVIPEKYGTGFWYVEGVGQAITLVNEQDLEVKSSFNIDINVLFDDAPFDQLPFGDASVLPSRKDYITINRASPDKNSWSRYNRWFHKDVIEASAVANGALASIDQTNRATRPIIEFNMGVKLYNYGVHAKDNVDVIDNFTTDVFSTIEGSTGYNIDGIDLAPGMRVLFTADTDITVKNKIYNVDFISVTPPSRQIDFVPETSINVEFNTFRFSTEHGLTTGNQVTYLQNGNDLIPGLVNRQVYYVRVIDTVTITLYTNALLTKQVDIFSLVAGTHQLEIFPGKRRQITLTESADTSPTELETVTINYGTNEWLYNRTVKGNQGQTYWYNGTTWKLAQVKTAINQPPLFDVFDADGNSYGNASIYDGSTFAGTKLFSYAVGTGTNDSVLGFPLTYQNIDNIGDIVFKFDLLSDSIAYKQGTNLLSKNTDVGYLKIIQDLDRFTFENGWTTSEISNSQPVVRVFRDGLLTNNFPVDTFDDKSDLEDLEVRVYVNGIALSKSSYTVMDGTVRKYVVLDTDVSSTDVVTLRLFASQEKNDNGYYELPISLQNNPLNENITQFTLGQVINHVGTIVDNINSYEGETYPGNSNLRDLGNLSAYGTRFVQHSGPMNLSLYHLGSKSANVIKALDKARNDYGTFKRAFIVAASESGIDTDPRPHVDYILQSIVKDNPKTSPYYLSDMFAYTASNRLEYTVLDSRIKTYPLTTAFNLTKLSNKAVSIYLNGEQLTHGCDYVFGDDVFFEILTDLAEDDLIEAYEYETTDGCFCPPTPTKLGLYPKFEPKIYVDNTYLEPTRVIRGHDGSITIAFNDYRDNLILELETRIFNNIKVEYDPAICDIYDFIPGYSRQTDYSIDEFNRILSKYFFQWTTNIQTDYTKDTFYDQTNSFTYNYRGNSTVDNVGVPAFWRGIYKFFFDTDTPNLHPWECLGFSVEPTWWQDIYGPAPYTSDNLILWDDLKDGIIREPGVPVRRNPKFARPILNSGVPVDESGKLVSPKDAGLVKGFIQTGDSGYYVFGDYAPVETAWRRSSYLPFAIVSACLLMQPNSVLGRCLDRSRITRNKTGQLIYSETGLRIMMDDVLVPSTANDSTRVYTSGLINYVVDYLVSENTIRIDQYKTDLKSLTNKMASKLGAFTSKPKYQILLDSKTPSSSGGVFVPDEDYYIDLNVSSTIKKVNYSGIVITKFSDGFEVRGYNFDNPYFTYYPYRQVDRVITVGGISESYLTWSENQYYVAGKLVRYNNQFFRVKTNHTSGNEFVNTYYTRLAELPVIGGREAIIGKAWDYDAPMSIAYGTKLTTIQEVVNLLQGYGAYLEQQGFVFDEFNTNLNSVSNWLNSINEFLFWTTQNWGAGAVISLSPSASKLIFNSDLSVVGDLTDQFNGYSVCRVDGQKLEPEFITAYRSTNEFILEPENTNYGIFGVTLYLLQKEHIVVLKNKTMFNDVIYDPPAGYRQDRVKILGYATSNWTGSFEIPGFIYDRAIINAWSPWTDYNLGDIVKHKEFYYSASKFLIGTETFEADSWVLLSEKPTAELLPNWDYKAETFTDFYDLDTDNFDAGQQKVAQHLIGYQKRQYLENIIQNDVSQYKFYQGMIIEKGTQNVLNKLFDVLSADGMESLTFDEEWAFRVGEYGAVDVFDEVEFILDESQFKITPQPIELVDTIGDDNTKFIYKQKPSDVYTKPLTYTSNIWPTATDNKYLRTPGYVRLEDVKINVNTLDDLLTQDVSTFREGDYVWCAFERRDWNVYRFTQTPFKITNITYANKILTITCNRVVDLQAGSIVGLTHTKVSGFYSIATVNLNTFTIAKEVAGWTEFADKDTILSYHFTSQRIANIDLANDIIPEHIKYNELLWADNNGNDHWAVYKNSSVYRKANIVNQEPDTNLEFGTAIAITNSGTLSAVADTNGVTIFEKSSTNNAWAAVNRIWPNPNRATSADFGSVLKFSADGMWLAIAAPAATHVDNSAFTNQGYISLYKKDLLGRFQFNTLIKSSTPANGEYFGSSISFGKLTPTDHLYADVSGNYIGAGAGALWNIVRKDARYEVIKVSGGRSYTVNSTILIPGSYLGGEDNDNDLIITATAVDSITGEITSFTSEGVAIGDTYLLAVSAPSEEPVNRTATRTSVVYTYKHTNTSGWELIDTLSGTAGGTDYFGYDHTMSADGSVLAISAPDADNGSGKVYVYKYSNDSYTLAQSPISITATDDSERFGDSVSLSSNGKYLAIGCSLLNVGNKKDVGAVFVYEYSTEYTQVQRIASTKNEINEQFGTDVEFMNNDETLLVFSSNGNIEKISSFDRNSAETSFDNGNLRIVDIVLDVGRVDIYDKYNTKFIYGESLDNTSLPYSGYGREIAAGSNVILVSASHAVDTDYINSGIVNSYVKPANALSWSADRVEIPAVNISKIKKVFLYNKEINEIVTYLDVVDPIQGKIPGIADQELKYKTFYDPAVYAVGSSAVNVDDGMSWTDQQVGTLWWDLTNAKFLDTQNGDVVYRTSIWNKLYPSASIDVYEWVETSLLPSAWNKQSETDAGLIKGISGTTKYGDEVYSVKKRYDSISKTFKETYYYWVKNKKDIPNVANRLMSCYDIASIIADPFGYGYSYIAFTSANSFSLANVEKYLEDKNIVLNIQYWTSNYTSSNAHSEWKLLSTNETTVIPTALETKWFHSLVGKDDNDRVVPDINLPAKQRYGIEFRPRQSMFVNRIEALKQFVENVNSALSTKLIADNYDLSKLEQYDPAPSIVSALWDETIDTDSELSYVATSMVQRPILLPVIIDGRIISVDIIKSGYGYGRLRVFDTDEFGIATSWYGPKIAVAGTGTGASLQSIIDSQGRIISTLVISQGEGYDKFTTLSIRDFAVLVQSDSSTYNSWSVYAWDLVERKWLRVRSQAYDVRNYWDYQDWYGTFIDPETAIEHSYNQFTKIDYLVENTYQLLTTEIDVGQIAKVKNIGSGGWLLLKKKADLPTIDYTQNFDVIGRENGTIQFLDKIYNFDSNILGYDGSLYDSIIFDSNPTAELKIILTSIRDNILVDDLRIDYLKAFFASVRYAIHEQTFVDWAFKTSFVKSMHNVGELKQKPTYNSDNLEFFEQYINEVKPYRSKVREYVSSYSNLDSSQTSVTDFDLLPVINNFAVEPFAVKVSDQGEILTDFAEINEYPWKHWNDGVGFEITSIKIVDNGNEYLTAPTVEITGVQLPGGKPASASAYITNGKVNRIQLISGGTRWISAPSITIKGGIASTGTSARAVAIIGNALPRTNYVKVKFDRVAKVYEITDLMMDETFSGTGARTQFNLKWSPNIKLGTSFVTVSDVEVLRDDYTLTVVESTSRGYTSYSGLLTFKTAPAEGTDNIAVRYTKNYNHLTATDRINFYYNPETGQTGKDLAQLMTGIDYGGTQIVGIDFGVNYGWDALPWFTEGWDANDPTFEDFIATTTGTGVLVSVDPETISGTSLAIANTYYDVPITTISGTGTGARANIIKTGSELTYTKLNTSILITTAGTGYNSGDQLRINGSDLVAVKGLQANLITGTNLVTLTNGPAIVYKNSLIGLLVEGSHTVTLTTGNTSGVYPGMTLTKSVGSGSFGNLSPIITEVIDSTTFTVDVVNAVAGTVTFAILKANGASTDNLLPGMNIVQTTGNGEFATNISIVDIVNELQFTVDIDHTISGLVEFNATGGLTEINDIETSVSAVVQPFRMPYVPEMDQQINIYVSKFDPDTLKYSSAIRVDDPAYATINQTNDSAIMPTFIGNNETDIISLPGTAGLQTYIIHDEITNTDTTYGDRVIFRKDTSDGSNTPREDEYDTQLKGGDLAYASATGVAPDDILLDGDDLISATNSPAPEEVVPGQVMDTLAIKVYHRPSGGCPNMLFNNYCGDNSKTSFVIGQYFPNNRSIIVKVDDTVKVLDTDYTIDYQSNTVNFNVAPSTGSKITILSISFNSANVLDLDYFVSDGIATEYITKANWLPTISSTVLVNGQEYSYVLFSTDDNYTDLIGQTWHSRAGIRFQTAPPAGAIINYIIDASDVVNTASIVRSETINYETGTDTYSLQNAIGYDSPLDQHVLVKVGQTILRPASANYFTMADNNLVYSLKDYKYITSAISSDNITVYKLGNKLTFGNDYVFDFDYTGPTFALDRASILLSGGVDYEVGDVLDAVGGDLGTSGSVAKFQVLSVNLMGTIQSILPLSLGAYNTAPDATFDLSGGSGTGATITATFEISENKPNISVNIKPDVYQSGAKLVVVIDTNTDYVISGVNNNSITFNNTYAQGTDIEIISFYNHNILGVERTTDQMTTVANTTPGTTEYYELSGKLGGSFRLRNTAVSGDFIWVIKNGELLMHSVDYYLDDNLVTIKLKDFLQKTDVVQILAFTNTVVHEAFAYMQFKDMLNRVHYKRLNRAKATLLDKDLTQFDREIFVNDGTALDVPNPRRNLPGIIEINGERIEYFTKVGNILGQLRRGTLGTGVPTYHSKDALVQCIGASETIPYKDENIVTTYTADGITDTIDLPYIPRINDVEVFVGGQRLKKSQYDIYANQEYPYSPEGDITLPAEFNITGSAKLRLTAVPAMGIHVVIVKKQGRIWNDIGQRLAKSNNSIANFLKATPTNWPAAIQDKYQDRVLDGSGDPLQTGDGDPLEY